RRRAVIVADPGLHAHRRRRVIAGDDVDVTSGQSRSVELAQISDGDGVRRGVERRDVERRAGCEAEATLLPDRVACDPAMRAELPALPVDDRARTEQARLAAPKEVTIVAVGHEADLLALGLVRCHEAEAPGMTADFVLRELADR